ncbi:MAG: hypothetical protein NVS9B1_23590 [Candidatus Dormibacteraceae bacterium]
MFSIPFAAKLGLGAAGSLLLLGTAAPAIASAASPAAYAATAARTTTAKSSPTHDRKADRKVALAAYIDAAAAVLETSPADLRAALKSGKSLSDLAKARGFTKETFGDAVVKKITPVLEHDVDTHQLTREEATHFEKALAKGHLPLWERHHRK